MSRIIGRQTGEQTPSNMMGGGIQGERSRYNITETSNE